jgi:predicted XRE-type DNA-binding protein
VRREKSSTTEIFNDLGLVAVAELRLGDLRRRQELTQHQVATGMGVRQPRVSQLESSRLSHVELATLRAYVQALGGNLVLVVEFGEERLILDS